MSHNRHPNTYCPGALELFWLIAESPRGTSLFGEDEYGTNGLWQGHATATELAAVLWPLDPNVPVNYPDLPGFSMNGLSPAQWVAFVLDHEAKPCQFGGSGRITKEGDDYIVPSTFKDHFNKTSLELGGGRPYNLPAWPKN